MALAHPWFLDKTNQRDLRRILKAQDLYAVNPRLVNGQFVISIAWGDFPPEESLFRADPVQLAKPVILVINGTSNTGRATLQELADFTDLYTVKATSRKEPSAQLSAQLPHVHWLQTDLSKESLLQVTKGVEKVFYIPPPAENRAELARNVAAALSANGVQYVLDLSVMGANYRAILFHNQLRDQEESLEASGVPYTHLRCSGWMENVLGAISGIKRDNTFYQSFGEGAMAMVAVADIGRAAARLLTRMGAENIVVDLSGPEPLSGESIAAALSELLGRKINYVSPPIEDTVAQLKRFGLEDWFAQGLGELSAVIQKGMASAVSPDGPRLLGEMTTFKEWLHKHKAAFQ